MHENKAIQFMSGNRCDADHNMVKVIRGCPYKDVAAVSDYMAQLAGTP